MWIAGVRVPNRYLRESYTESKSVNELSWQSEVTWTRLLVKVDDWGRIEADFDLLRTKLFPRRLDKVREADLQRSILECDGAGLVRLYESNSRPYLQMMKWEIGRAEKSKYPDPPKEILDVCYLPRTAVRGCTQRKTFPPSPTPVPFPSYDSGTDSVSVSVSESARMPASSKGFPDSVDDALKQCCLDAIPKEFVMTCFDKALSRGGKDARQVPIENFPAYCRTEHKYERERLEKEKVHNKSPGPQGVSTADKILWQGEYERLVKRMATINGQYEAHQSWSEDDRAEWKRHKVRRDELKKQLNITI